MELELELEPELELEVEVAKGLNILLMLCSLGSHGGERSMWLHNPYPPPPCASTAAVPEVRPKRRFNAHPVLRQGRACA